MRRTLAVALVALTTLATPALADDPVRWLKDTVKECMDCVPAVCQIVNSCAVEQ